jgi:hypothetical protein
VLDPPGPPVHQSAPSPSRLEVAIFVCGVVTAVASGVSAYWISGPYGELDRDDPRVIRIVDPATGRLRLLIYDADGDGRFETRSYMDGERLLRIEIDEDGHGLVDRWEYYAPDGTLERVASSSRHNGQPDLWREVTPAHSAGRPATARGQ